ncbi:ADP-ribosyltransferase [Lentilactobacillus raoultii]|uniref:ADP-ribosyltransferase n=1 Tax=Lentilactobacillus raoultii TaxID=1987503 RepID=A0ABW3PJ65_9LACO|nr:ADP-ribosyltransferase [Lentilactobacillus raoultii]
MKKVRFVILTATLLIGISASHPAAAKATHQKEPMVGVEVTSNTTIQNVGPQSFVTKRTVTGFELVNDQPDTHNPVTIPKNTALTVHEKLAGNRYLVTVPGNPAEIMVQNPKQSAYSFKSLKSDPQKIKRLTTSSLKWAKHLTSDQKRAIRYYTGDGYDAINNTLRGLEKKQATKINAKIQNINSGLRKFKLTKPMTVFRGTSTAGLKKSLDTHAIQVGGQYLDPAYSSTTLTRSVAVEFSKHVILKINVPIGYHGAYIDPISKNKGEKEYLLNAGTPMIITKLQKGYTTISIKVMKKQSDGKKKVQTLNRHFRYWFVTLDLTN